MTSDRAPVPYSSHRLRLAFSGLHPQRIHTLVQKAGDPAGAVRMIEAGRVKCKPAAREAVRVPAGQRISELESLGVGVVLLGEDDYPPWLATIPDPPDLLFVKGNLPVEAGVAVVGSRRATRYGLNLARTMGAAMGRRAVTVVSGLARGVDGAVHRGVVEAGGCGVAVLGSGPDRWYPVSHRSLGEALLERGRGSGHRIPSGHRSRALAVSGSQPDHHRYVRVVLVVEAAIGGGALISARLGLEQGREVVAIPGDIDRATSRGCNELIRDGALPLLGTADLLDFLEMQGLISPQTGNGDPHGSRSNARGPGDLEQAIGESGASVEKLIERAGMAAVATARGTW